MNVEIEQNPGYGVYQLEDVLYWFKIIGVVLILFVIFGGVN